MWLASPMGLWHQRELRSARAMMASMRVVDGELGDDGLERGDLDGGDGFGGSRQRWLQ